MSLLTLIVVITLKYICISNHHNVDHKLTHVTYKLYLDKARGEKRT